MTKVPESIVPQISSSASLEDPNQRLNGDLPVVGATPSNGRGILLSLLAVGAVFFFRYAQDLFVPIAISVLIAYALNPLVTLLEHLRIPRAIAAALVILGLLGSAGYGMYALRYQAQSVIESLPEAAVKVRAKIEEVRASHGDTRGTLGSLQQVAKEIEGAATDGAGKSSTEGVTTVQIQQPTFRTRDYLWAGSVNAIGLTGQAILVSFLVFFLLSSGDFFKRKLVRVIGTRLAEKRITYEALSEIGTRIERFLLAQVFTGFVVGVLTAFGLWAAGLRQPIVWGLAAAILNFVPYFGAFVETAGLGLVAFLQFDSVGAAGMIAGLGLLIHGLASMLLVPVLMGKVSRMNGVAMFLSLLFWSWLWGVIGMILAVPITMVIKSVCDRVEGLQALGSLLDEA